MIKIGLAIISCVVVISSLVACSNDEKVTEVEPEVITEVPSDYEEIIDEANEEELQVIAEEEEKEAEGIHHHDDLHYEWAGSFTLSEGTYSLVFSQNEHGDESMLVAFLLENKNIHDLEHHAAHLFEAEAETVEQGGHFHAEHEYVYHLLLNAERTVFTFTINESGTYRLFTEHHPDEFLMTITGETGVVEPANEKEYEGHHHSH